MAVTSNTFDKGMVRDYNELLTLKSVSVNALNATLTTFNGNELALQNDMGNIKIVDKEGNVASLPENYIPVGVAAKGGILYIASVIYEDGKIKSSEIGCFPSPSIKNGKFEDEGKLAMLYSPLPSFYKIDSSGSSLKTCGSNRYLNFDLEHPVDILIQDSYDNSVNLIINDNLNTPRIINTGFGLKEGNTFELVKRYGYNNTNAYPCDLDYENTSSKPEDEPINPDNPDEPDYPDEPDEPDEPDDPDYPSDPRIVDLGLSVKWADRNIGANSVGDYGGYYAWADPTGLLTTTKPSDIGSIPDIKNTEYDIAHVQWGSHWRLPTINEILELFDNCECESSMDYKGTGVSGFIFTKNGKELFIPASGYRQNLKITDKDMRTYLWTSEAITGGTGTLAYSTPAGVYTQGRTYGSFYMNEKNWNMSIRPVYDDGTYNPPEESEDIEIPTDTVDLELTNIDDESFGILWCTHNLGAINPEDIGDYYRWGELITSNGQTHYLEDYKFFEGENEQGNPHFKYIGDICGNSEYDAATYYLGSGWRLPTRKELTALVLLCDSETITQNGVYGLKFTNKKNGKSIFLPSGGYKYANDSVSGISYWSGTADNTYNPDNEYCYVLNNNTIHRDYRACGRLIRPVFDLNLLNSRRNLKSPKLTLSSEDTTPTILNNTSVTLNTTNYSEKDKIDFDLLTSLINKTNSISHIGYDGLTNSGQLRVGMYSFYIVACDKDENESDFICESGVIPIFHGIDGDIHTIDGGQGDERTDKGISLTVYNVDESYKYIKVYYSRCTSQDYLESVCSYTKINNKYEVKDGTCKLIITGYESSLDVSKSDINPRYLNIERVRTQAICQNILFLGNITNKINDEEELLKLSLTFYPKLDIHTAGEGGGLIDGFDYDNKGYASSKNVYQYVGYHPEEIYRFGIVYIFSDNSLSTVYNILGVNKLTRTKKSSYPKKFDKLNTTNNYYLTKDPNTGYYVPTNTIDKEGFNLKGVCLIDNTDINFNDIVGINITKDTETWNNLKQNNPNLYNKIKGFFFVRLKRIPTILGQGYVTNVFEESFTPTIHWNNGGGLKNNTYIAETFCNATLSYLIDKPTYDDTAILNHIPKSFSGAGTGLPLIPDKNEDEMLKLSDLYSYRLLPIKKEIIVKLNKNGLNSDEPTKEGKYSEVTILNSLEKDAYAIFCPDYELNQAYYNNLYTGSKFKIKILETNRKGLKQLSKNERLYEYLKDREGSFNSTIVDAQIISVGDSVSVMSITPSFTVEKKDDIVYRPVKYFSAKCGNAEDYKFKFVGSKFIKSLHNNFLPNEIENYHIMDLFTGLPSNTLRGLFGPYLGATTKEEISDCIINIYIPNYDVLNMSNYFKIRFDDSSEYYAISDRKNKTEYGSMTHYRGDCYIGYFTHRLNRNFQDPTAPNNEDIVSNSSWKDAILAKDVNGKDIPDTKTSKDSLTDYRTVDNTSMTKLVNVGDLNAVKLGSWIKFPCRSSFNIAMRSKNKSYAEENVKMGNNGRTFYPLEMNYSGSGKVAESDYFNKGLNKSGSERIYAQINNDIYTNQYFKNRIAYSNVQIKDNFQNGNKIFEIGNFEDYTNQYGSIVKLLSLNNQLLFCVLEHAVGLLEINERAAINNEENDNIYIKSQSVLPSNIRFLSTSLGSKWENSIIQTETRIYGVDGDAKKIWRTDGSTLDVISDFNVSKFLNEHLKVSDKICSIGTCDLRTHYNKEKGDIMFTMYNYNEDVENIAWNLCFNENINNFVTYYSWIPSISSNIGNTFISFDLQKDWKILNYKISNVEDNKNYLWRHGHSNFIYSKERLLPTNWYGQVQPFEYEFIVAENPELHKIFDNLLIVGNKAVPESFHYEIIGESYDFAKDKINAYTRQELLKALYKASSIKNDLINSNINFDTNVNLMFDGKSISPNWNVKSTVFPMYYNRVSYFNRIEDYYKKITSSGHDYSHLSGTELVYYPELDEIRLWNHSKAANIDDVGILKGNMKYIEDRWSVQINPIIFVQKNEQRWEKYIPLVLSFVVYDKDGLPINLIVIDKDVIEKWKEYIPYYNGETPISNWDVFVDKISNGKYISTTSRKECALKDKFIKIRIRYSGKELATVNAVNTTYRESYS